MNQVAAYYQETLGSSPEALAYLETPGPGRPGRARVDRGAPAGFANRTLGYRLPAARIKARAELRGRLQALGVLRQSGHEHFNGCLVVPVFDEAGNAVEVYGRKIGEGADAPLHLYLPGAAPWRVERARPGRPGRGDLCESLIDAMTFWCAGHRNVTAAYGVEGLTDDHLAIFKRCGVQRVLIAYDRDEAGERGAAKPPAADGSGPGVLPHPVPQRDGRQCLCAQVTPAAKSLGLLIRKAVWMGQGAPPADRSGALASMSKTRPCPARRWPSQPPVLLPSPSVRLRPLLRPAPTLKPSQWRRGERDPGDRRWRVRGLARTWARRP